MKRASIAFVLVTTILGVAPQAGADLRRGDPDDVGFRLDLRIISSISTQGSLGLGIYFFEETARRRLPRVRVLYDAFGSPTPDYVLRFHYYEIADNDFRLACDFVRLADRTHLSVSPPDDWPDYMYCEFPRPGGMPAASGVRLRVVAVMPGVGRDLAPDIGWYPHT